MELAAWEVLLIGNIIVLSILSKAGLERLGLPDFLGYLLIGVELGPGVVPQQAFGIVAIVTHRMMGVPLALQVVLPKTGKGGTNESHR